MVLLFDGDVFTTNKDGARLLAIQAEKAKQTVQIASLDGTDTAWSMLNAPGLLLVNRGRTLRVSGKALDDLISACLEDGEFVVGRPTSSD